MTLRQSLARYVRGLLLEEMSPPAASDPPTQSPVSTPPTTTPSTTTSATSEAGLLTVVLDTMRQMQTEQLRETREMVLSILQGRPMDSATTMTPMTPSQPETTQWDPPDYDSADLSDLPSGIQGIFEREDQEVTDLRNLRTEREVLASQLSEARARILDPQGPGFELS